MTTTFLAYIDESGDDGLEKFRSPFANGGASTWLVLTACVVRRINDLEMVRWTDEIRRAVYPQNNKKDLHFKDLNHSQRLTASRLVASKPVRFASVLAAKKSVSSEVYREKNQLYFYMARFLLERVSWLCRDLRPSAPEGDGRVAVTFSRRGGMSYPNFQTYLRRLRDQRTEIHWPVIDLDSISARDHSTSASLKFADIGASSLAAGIEPDFYGNCEHRYGEFLKPVIYNRKGNYFSYGLKTFPHPSQCDLLECQKPFFRLFT